MKRMRRCALFGLGLLSPLALAAPSFDCKKAAQPVEVELCSNAALGDLDREMAEAYQAAKIRLADDPKAQADLKASQRMFILIRDQEFVPHAGNDYELDGHMEVQRDLLRGIQSQPRQGFAGDWKTTEASLWIAPSDKEGQWLVNAQSMTYDSKHWSCEFLGEAKLENGQMIVAGRDQYQQEYDGWRLQLERDGRMLVLHYLPPKNHQDKGTYNPFCGMNGTLTGRYFAVDAPSDNPCAGVPAGQCGE